MRHSEGKEGTRYIQEKKYRTVIHRRTAVQKERAMHNIPPAAGGMQHAARNPLKEPLVARAMHRNISRSRSRGICSVICIYYNNRAVN